MHWDAKKILLKILPFCNTFIEKPEIKNLSNIKLLQELPFNDELSIVKNSNVQLKVSKSSIKGLCKNFLNEIKVFKYQITLAALLSKIKTDESIKYSPV